jgi:23S rRNA pseudouridine1911/1915/1917 synthase
VSEALPLDRVADEAVAGRRLDAVVTEWLGEARAQVQRRCTDGQVLVDGEPAAKSHRLRVGERVVVRAGAPAAQPAPPPAVPVRWEDEHLAVVAKPAGLVVHAGAGLRPEATLVDALRGAGLALAESEDADRPGIVHRLDRGTSGLLVVAKTAAARQGLVRLFDAHGVERVYWALVQGVPDPPRATVDAPIARSPRRRTRFVVDPAGRRAVTHYDVTESLGEAAVLEVRLETGRTHQVRVHMAAVGHPIAGDAAYGGSMVLAERLGLERPALHAQTLGFVHPVTGARVRATEPLPDDLVRAVKRLREAGEKG